MGRIKGDEAGFSVVETMLVIVVVGLVGGVGFMVYKNYNKKPAVNTTTSKTTTKPATTETTPTPQATADSYANWKTYCDSATNGCFRYPSDWNDLIKGTDVTALGGNKGGTLTLEYSEPANAKGGLGDFFTKSIDPITISGNSYQVVGGYYTVSNVPGYYLVDASLAQQLGLKAGASTKITDNDLYFTFAAKKATFDVHYNTAASGGASSIATATATAWFSSADGQTALKTMQSFYKQ